MRDAGQAAVKAALSYSFLIRDTNA